MSIDNINIAGRNSVGMPTEHATRPFRWLVKREMWEHDAVQLVPLAAAVIILIAMLLNIPHAYRTGVPTLSSMQPELQRVMLATIFAGIWQVVWTASVLAAMFYCLDALHAERRDRSILFWKSMPVSDLKTVLAKLVLPLLVLPLVAFVVIVVLEVLVTLNVALIAAVSGRSAAFLWSGAPLLPVTIIAGYALLAMTLWLAPIYAWLLLVSAWARRAAFLWAVLPLLALCLLEKIVLDTSRGWDTLTGRFMVSATQAFATGVSGAPFRVDMQPGGLQVNGAFPHDIYAHLTPLEFLSMPGLWLGLVCAAAFVAAALFVRRRRDVL